MVKRSSKEEKRHFDIILILILLLVLATYLDLNITLEQIFNILIG